MMKVIDTFKDYKDYIEKHLEKEPKEKMELWESYYNSNFPDVERKCKEDYEAEGYSWREIGLTKVFNRTKEDFPKMIEGYNNLLKLLKGMDEKVKDIFHVDIDINIVIYSGLLNSAGWVDKYEGKRAMLFGIDKIAELGWQHEDKIKALICHELCHVAHFQIRSESNLPEHVEHSKYNEGIWNIYEEGFAQYFQQVLGESSVDSRGEQWNIECEKIEEQLKEEYIKALEDKEKGTRDFYGDWFKVLGISDVGYFLGSKLIANLSRRYTIEDIAFMEFDLIEKEVLKFLKG